MNWNEFCINKKIRACAKRPCNKLIMILYSVFQLENEKGRAPGRALCAKWAREGTF